MYKKFLLSTIVIMQKNIVSEKAVYVTRCKFVHFIARSRPTLQFLYFLFFLSCNNIHKHMFQCTRCVYFT